MQSHTVHSVPVRRSSFFRKFAIVLIVMVAVAVVAAMWIDRRGREFFESGKSIVLALDAFAKSLQSGDAAAMGRAISPDFAGTRLGLTTRELASEKTGIRVYRQTSDNAAANHDAALAEYRRCYTDPETIHAMCEDYRAGATIDMRLDEENQKAGRRIACPVQALWGQKNGQERWYDVPAVWRDWADSVEGHGIDCGHYLAEEAPDETLAALEPFLARAFRD